MLVSLVSILSVDNLKLVVIGVVEKTSSGDEGSTAEVFYNVKNGSSFITLKVRQRISVMKTNTLYVSRELAF